MDWYSVGERLYRSFEQVARAASARFPTVRRSISSSWDLDRCRTTLVFIWDPTREFEDLQLSFRRELSSRAPRDAYGDPLFGQPPGEITEYIEFEIERGAGETILHVGPRWLSRALESEYWEHVDEFVSEIEEVMQGVHQQILNELERSRETPP